MKKIILSIISSLVLTSCFGEDMPPVAEKVPHKFSLHGKEIIDDYAWLRDKNWPNVTDKKVLDYLEAENKYSESFFSENKMLKDRLFKELKSRIKLTDQTVPVKKDNYFYYSRTELDKNYSIYCRKEGSLEDKEEIYLDVNELAKDKNFTKISALSPSPDHKLLAYSVDFEGNEQYRIYVKDIKSGKLLKDEISSTIGQAYWHESGKGFFYTPVNENWRHDKVMYHALGTDPKDDILIMQENDILNQLSISKSSSREYFFIESSGHDSSEIYYFSMDDNEFKPKLLLSRKEKIFYDIDHSGEYFYIRTNDKGPNFRLARLNVNEPSEDNMKDYLPHQEKAYLDSFDVTKNYIVTNYKDDALPFVTIYRTSDGVKKDVNFPDEVYTASGYSPNFEEDHIRIGYSSLKRPDSVFSFDYADNKMVLLKQQEIPSGFFPDEYIVKREWVQSGDVKVPVSIFYKKGLVKKDGKNPVYLYGYGSYGYSVPPSFRNTAVSLVDRGFIYVIAHIRGGDDLGFEWYESSKFLNKKRTFQDFIESAYYLIEEGYTSKGMITIAGGSAGGLLVGYTLNNAPEILKSAVAHVPFVDVVNTMLDETLPLTPGEFKEWGNPKEKEYFEYMLSYSPYDNVKRQSYPNILATAGLSDPRVTYWEAAKWIAKIRDHNINSERTILLKTNMSAGHAGASGRFDYLKEVAEELAFVLKMYGIEK